MKIFKNKVGRPSNRIKTLRKIFCISMLAIIISFIAVIFSGIAIVNNAEIKIKGYGYFDSLDSIDGKVTMRATSSGGETGTDADWMNSWEYSSAGTYDISFYVKNNSNKTLYYRFFEYNLWGLLTNNSMSGTSYLDGACTTPIRRTYFAEKEIKNKITISSAEPFIEAILKVYSSKLACMSDNDGTNNNFVARNVMDHRHICEKDPACAPGLNNSTSNTDTNTNTNTNTLSEKNIFIMIFSICFAPLVPALKILGIWDKMIDYFDKSTGGGTGESDQVAKAPTEYLGYPLDEKLYNSVISSSNASCFPNYCDSGNPHGGVDLGIGEGNDVKAMDYGKVVEVGDYAYNCYQNCDKGQYFGIYVVIRHEKPNCSGDLCIYDTVYAHLSKRKVNLNDIVKKGTVIGKSGNTGNSSDPHLHIELRNVNYYNKNGRKSAKKADDLGLMNPANYIGVTKKYIGQYK